MNTNAPLEDKNEWQAWQNARYHEILADAKAKDLNDDKIARLFAADFHQYEQDKSDAVDDLKDRDRHAKIMKKVTKKFSDLVCAFQTDLDSINRQYM